MFEISIEEAKKQFLLLVQKAITGQEVIITQGSVPVAKLIAISKSKPQPQFGSAKGLITISEDFNEPLEDLKEYMQ